MVPFGRLAQRQKAAGRSDLQPLSVFLGDGVVPRSDREDNHNRLGADMDKYLFVQAGDIVFNKLRTWQGGFGHSRYEGVVSPAYFVCRPQNDVEPRFLHHLLHSSPYLAELTRISKFMPPSQFDILWDDLKALPVPKPPLEEQRAIADYLDTETTRIDALIERRSRLRNLVIERFRSLVSETVGLGPRTEIRRVIRLRTSGPRGWAERVGDVGAPFIRSQNLRRDGIELDLASVAQVDPPETPEARRSRTALGDVLIGITGANTGWIGIVREQAAGGYVSQHVAVLRPDTVLPEWLAYSLFSHQAQEQLLGGQYGGTKTQLGLDDLADLDINVPGREQQEAAIAHLAGSLTVERTIDAALSRQLDLLQEHRQALITAAVTGELSVPGVAA